MNDITSLNFATDICGRNINIYENTSFKQTIFSIGLEDGFPVRSAGIGEIYSFAIGAFLQVEYLVAPYFGLTLKAGYLNYPGKMQ